MKFYSKNKNLIHGLILASLPLLMCIIYMMISRKTPGDVWLGASSWNDEFFYYKQVECVVSDNIPTGYFGYNESSAKLLSFGAWSPVIILPWALFGKIFGWNYSSPFICNFLFITVSLFLYGFFAKLSLKKTMVSSAFILLTTPLVRYIFSCMPEIMCISLLIVFLGLVVGYDRGNHKDARRRGSYILCFLLTIIRPYYVLFFVFPFLLLSSGKKRAKMTTSLWALFALIIYFLIESKMTAEYFGNVYSTAWVDVFFEKGLMSGLTNLFQTIGHYIVVIASTCYGGIRSGNGIGIYFASFLFLLFVMVIEAARRLIKKLEKAYICLSMSICMIGILGAIILMYSIGDGFRHLLAFTVSALLVAGTLADDFKVRDAFIIFALGWLFVIKTRNDPLYFKVPFEGDTVVTKQGVDILKTNLSSEMISSEGLSWDNTVLMVFNDYMDDESDLKLTTWQYGYSLPKSFAVSLGEREYVVNNISNVKSGYILTPKGGEVEKKIIESGMEYIGGNTEVSVYHRIGY